MALVKFRTGTSTQYTAATKESGTFYHLTDTNEFYLGTDLLADGGTAPLTSADIDDVVNAIS